MFTSLLLVAALFVLAINANVYNETSPHYCTTGVVSSNVFALKGRFSRQYPMKNLWFTLIDSKGPRYFRGESVKWLGLVDGGLEGFYDSRKPIFLGNYGRRPVMLAIPDLSVGEWYQANYVDPPLPAMEMDTESAHISSYGFIANNETSEFCMRTGDRTLYPALQGKIDEFKPNGKVGAAEIEKLIEFNFGKKSKKVRRSLQTLLDQVKAEVAKMKLAGWPEVKDCNLNNLNFHLATTTSCVGFESYAGCITNIGKWCRACGSGDCDPTDDRTGYISEGCFSWLRHEITLFATCSDLRLAGAVLKKFVKVFAQQVAFQGLHDNAQKSIKVLNKRMDSSNNNTLLIAKKQNQLIGRTDDLKVDLNVIAAVQQKSQNTTGNRFSEITKALFDIDNKLLVIESRTNQNTLSIDSLQNKTNHHQDLINITQHKIEVEKERERLRHLDHAQQLIHLHKQKEIHKTNITNLKEENERMRQESKKLEASGDKKLKDSSTMLNENLNKTKSEIKDHIKSETRKIKVRLFKAEDMQNKPFGSTVSKIGTGGVIGVFGLSVFIMIGLVCLCCVVKRQ